MKAFTFQAPPNILFEAGASRKLAELVAGYDITRVLLVTDRGVRNAGLTANVVKELDRALADHELVKVSARVGERSARDAALDALATQTSSDIVQRIGNVGVFYRRSAQLPKILLPDA